LSKLDVLKAGLSTTYLKEIAEAIVPPLTNLYNESLKDAWKQSNITPVHKGGCIDDPSNYRPISVLPVVAKVFEKIVSTQLYSYLEINKLLHPHQDAF